MSKSLHPIVLFAWGYILFARVQCRGTLRILNESKLSEHKRLCFRRCDIGFGVDDRGTSSKEIFRRRSCYERCLRGEGEMKSVKTKRGVFVDELGSSLFKRIRRYATSMADNPNSGIKYGGENCAPGNAVNGTRAMFPTELGIVFHESKGKRKGRYKGIVTWKALQNESVDWTGI
ncbi:uncharacterized protein LOC111322174 [Stylophora pistillata]|uniref:uncharacterized protein LOC111322174 n=1 Tax=Stylophora pistillata TaxID=50429 RepID=UPI000C043688|nr:uncharacterized protein LOC111322174 [Stylophora pistillata]